MRGTLIGIHAGASSDGFTERSQAVRCAPWAGWRWTCPSTQRWCRTGKAPALDLWQAAHAQIARRWWVVENVRGAQAWVGKATLHLGPFYLWTNIPAGAFAGVPREAKFWGAYKQRIDGRNRAKAGRERGAIPQIVAKAVTDWAQAHP